MIETSKNDLLDKIADKKQTGRAATKKSSSRTSKKRYRIARTVNIHVAFTKNTTLVTVCDEIDNKLFQISPPTLNFKGPKKRTQNSAQLTMKRAIAQAIENHKAEVIESIKVSGPGIGRDVALKAVKDFKITTKQLIDVTKRPYNGVRAKGPRSL